MSDQARLILAPAARGWSHTPDSVQIRADCGCQCWISPVNMTHLLNPFLKTITVCMPHVLQDPKAMAALKRQGKAYAFPGTREEMAREIGQEETDQLWQQWGIGDRGADAVSEELRNYPNPWWQLWLQRALLIAVGVWAALSHAWWGVISAVCFLAWHILLIHQARRRKVAFDAWCEEVMRNLS